MSPKGYSAVPTEEPQDSTDMESRIAPTEDISRHVLGDEPEVEPTANDRLLPSDGADLPSPREPLTKRVTRWLRSRPPYITSRYKAFKKRCTARGVFLFLLIALLLASTTGLAISTGILALRPRWCHNYSLPGQSRIPWVWKEYPYTYTRSYRADLASLYPPLSEDAESSCKFAWARMGQLECHEKILNRAWDNGRQLSIFEPRYDFYAAELGSPTCLSGLEAAYQLLASQCTERDTFDTTTYVGPFTADPELETGPVAAIKTLLDRARHSGRRPPRTVNDYGYGPEPAPCAAELYEDWFIIDGLNSGNLHGLDVFLKATANRTESERGLTYRHGEDRCDDVSAPYRPYVDYDVKKGPNDGETTCSWCLVNWFDRKLQSWEDGKVVDPVNGTEVSLPTYLRTIERAGRRCQAHDWDRIWKKNVWMYQERGLLGDDWDKELEVPTSGTGGRLAEVGVPPWPARLAHGTGREVVRVQM